MSGRVTSGYNTTNTVMDEETGTTAEDASKTDALETLTATHRCFDDLPEMGKESFGDTDE